MVVYERPPGRGRSGVSGSAFRDWRDHQTQFTAIAFYGVNRFDLTGLDPPEKIEGLMVSADFNRVLGVPPLLGRGFQPEDDKVGGQNDVVMLTERFWRARFAASPAALSKSAMA